MYKCLLVHCVIRLKTEVAMLKSKKNDDIEMKSKNMKITEVYCDYLF